MQLVPKLLVVWGVSTTERQHENLGQKSVPGHSSTADLGAPSHSTEEGTWLSQCWAQELPLLLLTFGTEEPALQLSHGHPKPPSLAGSWCGPQKRLSWKVFPLDSLSLVSPKGPFSGAHNRVYGEHRPTPATPRDLRVGLTDTGKCTDFITGLNTGSPCMWKMTSS